MFGARASVALALACALLPAFPRPVAADAPVPLDYKAYDGWSAIRTPKLSDDGTHLAYALTPQDGDPTLGVRGRRPLRRLHARCAQKGRRRGEEGQESREGPAQERARDPRPRRNEARRDRRQRQDDRRRQGRRRDDRVPRRAVAGAERLARAGRRRVAGRVGETERAAQGRTVAAGARRRDARAGRERLARALALAV